MRRISSTVRGLLLSGLVLTCAVELVGQAIQPSEQREKFIATLEAILNPAKPSTADNSEPLKSPFSRYIPEIVPEAAEEGDAEVAAAAKPVVKRLSDAAALELIARSFRPRGGIVMGTRGILQFEGGQTMSLGSEFKATIREETYAVRVIEIREDGYKLRLGTAEIDQLYARPISNEMSETPQPEVAEPAP